LIRAKKQKNKIEKKKQYIENTQQKTRNCIAIAISIGSDVGGERNGEVGG